jgi:glycogen debranching enzyme
MAPYQERPQVHPLELHLHIDPKTDRNKFFPLLLAVGQTTQTAATSALAATLASLDQQIPALYKAHTQRLELAEKTETTLQTPDEGLDGDFTWAQTSINQLRAKAPSGETALVAGYYASGDSARPGFGWFFGRDALYTLYAVDSYGDFSLARTELDFLLKRQRADGKIMHEYSQTAGELIPPNDWASLPYEYAAADATPLFLTVMLDYVNTSGDLAYLHAHHEAILKAWQFETTHDFDGDGIYDNAQGTGWVESWPPGMPHQEIYLALLDQQASAAMAALAKLLDEPKLAAEAAARETQVHQTIEREYYRPETQTYAFSYNGAGKLDTTSTIFPAIAYWNRASLDHSEASLRAWASHDFATDWGARDLAESDSLYDPISYHQGSVWPLFTGWAALAQYRAGRPLAGYQATMQNADLTTAQDIGAVTELLSGAFFEPFGRSTSHQLWSSAMVITPILRGLFGLEPDALHHTLRVTPHLPADWPSAEIHNLHIGASTLNLKFRREDATLVVTAQTLTGAGIALAGADAQNQLHIALPPVEVSIPDGLPLPGARTHQLKVLNEARTEHSYTLELEAQAGTELHLPLRRNNPTVQVQAEGAILVNDDLQIAFPAGSGYQAQIVTLSW